MTHPHIVRVFDQELERLRCQVEAMGCFASAQLADAVRALTSDDLLLAERVVTKDQELDAWRHELSSTVVTMIALRQPLAIDLQEVVQNFRIVNALERIGDLAKNIAKRANVVNTRLLEVELLKRFMDFAALVNEQLRQALLAFVHRDVTKALELRCDDEQIDKLHTDLFRDMVAHMETEHSHMVGYVHLLFCAKNMERVGDHATHIAESTYVIVTGLPLEKERRRFDQSSLIGEDCEPSAGRLDDNKVK